MIDLIKIKLIICILICTVEIYCQKESISYLKDSFDTELQGNIDSVRINRFSALLVNKKIQKVTSSNSIGNEIISEFNEKRQLTKRTTITTGNKLLTIVEEFSYDSVGHLILITRYAPFDSFEETYNFIYDEKGQLVLKQRKNPELKTLNTTEQFSFDENRNIIDHSFFSSDTLPYKNFKYSYDSFNNLVSSSTYRHDTFINQYEYTYDKNNLIVEIRIKNSESSSIRAFQYDNLNNPISIKRLNNERTFHSETIYKYKYDEYNNWIERQKIVNTYPHSIIERHIYYN